MFLSATISVGNPATSQFKEFEANSKSNPQLPECNPKMEYEYNCTIRNRFNKPPPSPKSNKKTSSTSSKNSDLPPSSSSLMKSPPSSSSSPSSSASNLEKSSLPASSSLKISPASLSLKISPASSSSSSSPSHLSFTPVLTRATKVACRSLLPEFSSLDHQPISVIRRTYDSMMAEKNSSLVSLFDVKTGELEALAIKLNEFENRPNYRDLTVDLHYLFLDEAMETFKVYMAFSYNIGYVNTLTVICGTGKEPGHSSYIKKEIEKFNSREGLQERVDWKHPHDGQKLNRGVYIYTPRGKKHFCFLDD